MTAIVDNNGLPNWNLTSRMLRSDNITWLGQYMKTMTFCSFDFGQAPELAFRCPGCGRWCPHETAPVDHIIPRTRITFRVPDEPIPRHIKFTGYDYELGEDGMFSLLSTVHHPVPVLQIYALSNYNQDIRYDYHDSGPLFQVPGIPQPFRTSHRIRVKELLENDIENLQFMCASCNSKKNNKTIRPGQFRPRFAGPSQLVVR